MQKNNKFHTFQKLEITQKTFTETNSRDIMTNTVDFCK